jgi:hypothetical protein
VIPATGETVALHAYWDSLFEEKDGLASLAVDDAAAKIDDPQRWIEESAELAQLYTYAGPISLGRNPVFLTREYETNARKIARSQAALPRPCSRT